jgi:hypothetical protein
VRVEAGRAPRHPLPPFHAELRLLLDEHATAGRSHADVAKLLRISPKTLECWLSEPSASWHREPHYLTQFGALTILRNLLHRKS